MKRTSVCIVLALCLVAPAIGGCSLLGGGATDVPGVPAAQVPPSATATETTDANASMTRVNVPNVVDMDVRTALQALEDAGLNGMIRWRRDKTDRRTVLSQSTPPGMMLASGAFVRLVVSLGPAPEVPEPPYLIAARKAAAAAAVAAQDEATSPTGGTTTAADPDDGTPTITFEDDPNDIPGIALPTSPISGKLFVGDPDDVYRILIAAGQTITFGVDPGPSTTDPDFHVRVFVPTATSLSGSPAAQTSTGVYPRNLTYTATTTGFFFINVHHSGTNPASGGDYKLTWSMGS